MKQIVIVGGGIIGLSSAYYLKQAGFAVTVIDPHSGKIGASYGNAGFIGSSHYTPLSNPSAFQNALRWMLSPTSPFYIQPALTRTLIDWGLLFMRHANKGHVDRSARPLAEIGLLSQRLYEEWLADLGGFSYEKKGLITVFQTEKALRGAELEIERARSFGLDAVMLDSADLVKLEPEVKFDAIGGIDMRTDAHTYPPKLMHALLETLQASGVTLIEAAATGFTHKNGVLTSVECGGQSYCADEFVLASGIWSREIAKSLGISLPMVSGRGYSMTYPLTQCPVRHPIYLGEASVAITPMDGDKVRLGGTMEIVPVGTPPRLNRAKGILNSARRFVPQASFPEPKLDEIWFGYRPVSADGLPYIGRHHSYKNLVVATGHSMLGLGLGPATGRLVCELAMNEPTTIDISAFSLERFNRR